MSLSFGTLAWCRALSLDQEQSQGQVQGQVAGANTHSFLHKSHGSCTPCAKQHVVSLAVTFGACTFTFWSVHHRDCALLLSKHGEDGLLLRPLVGTDEGTEEGEWAG